MLIMYSNSNKITTWLISLDITIRVSCRYLNYLALKHKYQSYELTLSIIFDVLLCFICLLTCIAIIDKIEKTHHYMHFLQSLKIRRLCGKLQLHHIVAILGWLILSGATVIIRGDFGTIWAPMYHIRALWCHFHFNLWKEPYYEHPEVISGANLRLFWHNVTTNASLQSTLVPFHAASGTIWTPSGGIRCKVAIWGDIWASMCPFSPPWCHFMLPQAPYGYQEVISGAKVVIWGDFVNIWAPMCLFWSLWHHFILIQAPTRHPKFILGANVTIWGDFGIIWVQMCLYGHFDVKYFVRSARFAVQLHATTWPLWCHFRLSQTPKNTKRWFQVQKGSSEMTVGTIWI